jgi:DNA-directed RNA polymerase delta subunit
MSAWPNDATMRIDVFDTLQDTYREWLLRGWVNIDAIDKALDAAVRSAWIDAIDKALDPA